MAEIQVPNFLSQAQSKIRSQIFPKPQTVNISLLIQNA